AEPRARRQLLSNLRQTSRAGLVARAARQRIVTVRLRGNRMRTENAMHRMKIVAFSELIQITTLAPHAGAHDVPRDLCPRPDVVRETDRTSSRGAITVAAIRHSNAECRADASDRGERRLDVIRSRTDAQHLDAKSIFV